MFLGRVIGKVWASAKDPTLKGLRLLVVEPLDHHCKRAGDPFVAVDVVNASDGETVYWVGSREAPNALPDKYGPIDAAVVGIADRIDL
ncbi:MAG: EutN/CcmL family microcompartment protein [bacterium]|jgi:ethanolamine utilization protein EutN|nr:EutN/CcmL family microcompartment protein [bacterium]